jgi:hypothetical protein
MVAPNLVTWAGEEDYEQIEKGRIKAEVEGEEAGKLE